MTDTVSVSRVIRAPADELWALVSDVTRMGEWSPETTAGRWVKGATGPAVGARFSGDNQHGAKSWSSMCEITACEPGRVFEFDAMAGPIRYSRWRYEFESADGATTVTESTEDRRNRLMKWAGRHISGVEDRAPHNRTNMEITLERLAAAAEGGAGA